MSCLKSENKFHDFSMTFTCHGETCNQKIMLWLIQDPNHLINKQNAQSMSHTKLKKQRLHNAFSTCLLRFQKLQLLAAISQNPTFICLSLSVFVPISWTNQPIITLQITLKLNQQNRFTPTVTWWDKVLHYLLYYFRTSSVQTVPLRIMHHPTT